MTSTEGIPKMTTDCKEIFSIFMKIGGTLRCDFEKNEGILYEQNIKCKNLNNIHDDLHIFEEAHKYYPNNNKLIKVNYTFKNEKIKPPFIYDRERDVRNMLIDIEFDQDGRY